MHTRVVVSCYFEGDLFVRQTADRGARFRDQIHIAEVVDAIKSEMTRQYAAYVPSKGELQFRVITREA
jgi:hypothetical protein